MALQAIVNRPDLYRVLIVCDLDAVYVYAIDTINAPGPFEDYYQTRLDIAVRFAESRYAIPSSAWINVPDEFYH